MTQSRLEGEGFVHRRLPWLVAVAAFCLYAVTLERSPTFAGIASLAKSVGWDWHPNLVAPLHVCLTYAVRWLPASAQLVGLNLTAAAAAAGSLGLLVRSVSLLPHDRTRLQRRMVSSHGAILDLRFAWMPPVVAAMICGLQRSFWENAVAATGEALDLLLFAWLVNSLIEYRLYREERRLTRFALVYGLAVANNFAMIGFAPAFLTALIWIQGAAFVRFRFLVRFVACGAAGLLLYGVCPLLNYVNDPQAYGFWEMLHSYLGYQKQNLLAFPRYVVLLCGMTSWVPMFLIGIRWPSRFGEVSRLGTTLTNLGVHLIHLTFLVACTWVAFDPLFSHRSLSRQLSAMLPFYYLGALTIGYCLGYALIAVNAGGLRAEERSSRIGWIACNIVAILICAGALAVPVALFARNIGPIQANLGEPCGQLLREAALSLPPEPAVVFSDDPFYLYGVQRELLRNNPHHKNLLIDTTSFASPEYHRFLKKKYDERWPGFLRQPPSHVPIDPANLINVVLQVGESMPLFYLHPSYGYYFEFLYPQPHRMLYQLLPYSGNTLSPPPLTPAELDRQHQYWSALRNEKLSQWLREPARSPPADSAKPEVRKLEQWLRGLYSRAWNDFGVAVQRSGDWGRAAEYYRLSTQMNASNAFAAANQNLNERIRQKQEPAQELDEATALQLKARADRWDLMLRDFGPADTPMACYRLAQAFASGSNFRQAGQQLERTLYFVPDNRSARLDYMMMCVRTRLADKAEQEVERYRASFGQSSITDNEEVELVRIQAWVSLLRTNLAAAEKILLEARAKYPDQAVPYDMLVEIYLQLGRETNALEVLQKQIAVQPRNVRAYVNYAGIKLRAGDPAGAIPFLDQALASKPDDEDGLYNRALAYSRTGKFDAAQRDFLALLRNGAGTYRLQAYLGLGEAYFQLRRPEESLRYFRDFLKNAGPGVHGADLARERVKALKQQASNRASDVSPK